MPAAKKDSKKAELLRMQSGLAVDERKIKRKAEQRKLDKVLDKDITCGPANMALPSMPAMPACLPQSRNGSQAGGDRDADKPSGAEPAKEAQPDAPDDAAQRKSANASSFWARWTGAREESTASLSTGKGNRVVPRSLRDAREDAVCKIESKGRSGSGFYALVQGKLAILTNNHVLPDKKAASIAVATFQTANMGTVEVALYPQKLFHTSPKEELDYSLVACEVPQGIQPIELVSSALPDVQQGDTIIIVQHPEGGEKSASSGPVFRVHPPYVTYEADTEPGSSGSPVLKNYDPIALHHRAPRNEESKGLLGSLSCSAQRTKHSNKGILLAAILTDLDGKLNNKRGKGESESDVSAGAKVDDTDTSKMAILHRLRAGAAACIAKKKEDMGVEDDEEAATTKGAGGWGGRANELMATCGGTRKKEGDVKKRKAKPKRAKGESGLAAVEEGEDGEEESAERDDKSAEETANGEEEDEEVEDDDEEEEQEESAGQDADEDAETGGVQEEEEEDANAGKKKPDKSNGASSWRSAMPSLPSASSVMNWYSAPKVAKEEEEEEEEEEEAEEGKQRSAKSWREGCAIPGMDMSPGNATPLKGTKGKGKKGGKDKDARACGVDTSTFGGVGGLPKFQMPAMFGGKAAANGDAADTAKGKSSNKMLKKRVVQQSEETRLIRAGVAGHGLVAKEEEEEGEEGEEEEDGEDEERDDDDENGRQGSGRRAMRISSRALDGQQCGVGLVLESWKPRGLAQALNLVARTNEAVRVDAVVPDGPADHAVPRMEKGDIVKEIDGVSVTSLAHAKELILGTPGSQVTIKLVRNQYPFDVTMRRGLRGGAHNYPPPDVEPVAPSTSARASETASRKFVQGIPALYSRASRKANEASAGASDAGADDADVAPLGTAERLLKAAQHREAAAPPPAATPAPRAPNERQPQRQQESALQARLRAMGYNSFSGDGPEDEDEEEAETAAESTARPSTQSSKHPMARFSEATAPRLRGVVASGSENVKELGQELLDKAWLGDVAAIKHLVAVGADPNFVDREAGWGGVTPLINAATNGQKSAVVTLLVLGAALEGKDVNGWTALHRAAGKGHKSVVVGLIEAGADVSARDSAGLTAKDWARFCGHEALVDLLTPTEKSEHEIMAELDRLQAQLAARQASKQAMAQPAATASPPPPASATTTTPTPAAVSPGATHTDAGALPAAAITPGDDSATLLAEQANGMETKEGQEEKREETKLEEQDVAESGGGEEQQAGQEPGAQEPGAEVQHETQGAEGKKRGNKKGKRNTAPSNGAQV